MRAGVDGAVPDGQGSEGRIRRPEEVSGEGVWGDWHLYPREGAPRLDNGSAKLKMDQEDEGAALAPRAQGRSANLKSCKRQGDMPRCQPAPVPAPAHIAI